MNDPGTAAAADAKVQKALVLIERAQVLLDQACQELCPIIGGVAQYTSVGKLHRQVELTWHRVAEWSRRRRGKLDLDESGRAAVAEVRAP